METRFLLSCPLDGPGNNITPMALCAPNGQGLDSKCYSPWLLGEMNDFRAKEGKMQYKLETSYCARKQTSAQVIMGACPKERASLIRDHMRIRIKDDINGL